MLFGSGGDTRDFVYVDDVVDAFSRAADRGSGLVLNVATGRETSFTELVQLVATALALRWSLALRARRAGRGAPHRARSDARRAPSRLAPVDVARRRPPAARRAARRAGRRTGARMIAVICGGVGAARLLAGLVQVVDPSEIVAIVNTGDDLVLHGLAISPDLDTITYTLSGEANVETGWGLRGESWAAMAALEHLGGAAWFRLGDRDLGTHLFRTGRLAAGATPRGSPARSRRVSGCASRCCR